jgi:hypothetical protein
MLPVDSLVADPRNLLGKPLNKAVVNVDRINFLHSGAPRILDPYLARAVD